KAVRIAKEIGRCLRRAADAGEFRDSMRLDVQLETSLDEGPRDRVVAAAGAQRRHRALVVAMGVAERVLGQRRMMEFVLVHVSHSSAILYSVTQRHQDTTLRKGVTLSASR